MVRDSLPGQHLDVLPVFGFLFDQPPYAFAVVEISIRQRNRLARGIARHPPLELVDDAGANDVVAIFTDGAEERVEESACI